MSYRADTLDCQTCGEPIRRLTPLEAQLVAKNPENYIIDCIDCQVDKDIEREKNENRETI